MMSQRSSVALRHLLTWIISLFVLVLLVSIMPILYQHLMITFLIGILLGESWNISGGFAGLFSFGHAAFFGVGAYTSILLFTRLGINPWLGMVIGGGAAAILALFLGFLFLRLKGIYFAIATLAFAEVLRICALNMKKITGGEEGIIIKKIAPLHIFGFNILDFSHKISFFYMVLLITLVVFGTVYFLMNSRWGYCLISNREDEQVAEAMGINTMSCKVLALALSAFFTGIAGSFYASYMSIVAPDPVFGVEVSMECVLVVIIGGIGTLWGPVIGSLIYIILTELVSSFFGEFHLFIHGALLMAFIMFLPYGAIGGFDRLSSFIKRGRRSRGREDAAMRG